MKGMKIIKLEYGSKRVARGAVSWSEEAATDEEGFLIGGEEEFIVGKMAGWEMGLSGQKRDGTRVYLGKGGQEVGKRTGFSHFETALTHLFPHVSTQVVDFPRICTVRLFGEEGFHLGDTETQRQAWLGTNIEKLSVKKCENFDDVSRFFTVYHPVEARNCAMFTFFRVRPFLNDEARKSKRVDTDRRRGGLFLLDGPGWAMYLGGSGD